MINNELSRLLYNRDGDTFKQLEILPYQSKLTVTKSDAIRGYIDRYFVKQVNDTSFIVEVNNQQYQEFQNNPRFITAHLKWKIVGKRENTIYNGLTVPGVEEYNRMQVSEADLTFDGLRKYIASYLEYWVGESI